jgi:D-tyrosyl-tRNA(Tyr) deacylase
VTVEGEKIGEIGVGFLILAGFAANDTDEVLRGMWRKIVNLRVFADDEGKMNRSLADVGGNVLIVSQFTLYADCRKGRRPSFISAAPPALGEELCDRFVALARKEAPDAGLGRVETGQFAAMMDVELLNDGPVTIWLDSDEVLPASVRASG